MVAILLVNTEFLLHAALGFRCRCKCRRAAENRLKNMFHPLSIGLHATFLAANVTFLQAARRKRRGTQALDRNRPAPLCVCAEPLHGLTPPSAPASNRPEEIRWRNAGKGAFTFHRPVGRCRAAGTGASPCCGRGDGAEEASCNVEKSGNVTWRKVGLSRGK